MKDINSERAEPSCFFYPSYRWLQRQHGSEQHILCQLAGRQLAVQVLCVQGQL